MLTGPPVFSESFVRATRGPKSISSYMHPPSLPLPRTFPPELLRGLAALVVFVHHFLLIFYPALFTTHAEHSHTSANTEAALAYTPLSFLWNGNFAVSVFFVLSGYVLSLGYFAHHDTLSPSRKALQRYPRLVLPAAASVFIAWLLLRSNAFANISTAQIYTHNDFWFTNLWNIHPDFGAAAKEAFLQSAFYGGTLEYNPVLWTINMEFIGSMLVFALLALAGPLRFRFIIYAVLCLLLYKSQLAAFITGVAIADYRHGKYFRALPRAAAVALIAAALYAGSFHWMKFLKPGEWGVLNYVTGTTAQNIYTSGAAVLLLCAVNTTAPRAAIITRCGMWLGKISFGLYLLHLLLIGSFSCRFFQWLPDMNYHARSAITFCCTLAIALPLSHLFWMFIDKPAIRLSRYKSGWFFRQKNDPEVVRNH
jgi:peptidoglycan/LPS O-acetylase OafA/YrhL